MTLIDARTLSNAELTEALRFYNSGQTPCPYIAFHESGLLLAAAARIDQLENEVNAVEWVNGRIEKELFDCRKRS